MAPRPSPVNEQPLPGYPMRPFWGILPDLYEKVSSLLDSLVLVRRGDHIHLAFKELICL